MKQEKANVLVQRQSGRRVSFYLQVQLCTTPATSWTVADQVLLSVGFSRQEYWSGLPFPVPGDLPDPRIKPRSAALKVDSLTSEPPEKLR